MSHRDLVVDLVAVSRAVEELDSEVRHIEDAPAALVESCNRIVRCQAVPQKLQTGEISVQDDITLERLQELVGNAPVDATYAPSDAIYVG